MKVEDLRIGNLVKYLGDVVKINGITIDSKKEDLYYITTRKGIHTNPSFQSIELTEDILLKCGFNNEWTRYVYESKTMVDVRIREGCFYLIINNVQIKPIKYLHELQNIFKELTGKELKYNE